MKRVIEGSEAVAEAVRLARVQVISAYPITPQTHIVEMLSEFCTRGRLAARFLRVESEHSCMAALIGAQTVGVRTFTASSGQGLALMHELLHWAAGARLPIVMAVVNRAMAPGWNIWVDQTDSLSQRDTGWLQMYCEDGQEVLDSTLQAFWLAEAVNLPVMVNLDAFYLSHTHEPVDVPAEDAVDLFLPPYRPRFRLDTAEPCSFNPMVPPADYLEMRYNLALAMEEAKGIFGEMERVFATSFGRSYGMLEAVCCDDAEIVLVTSGTMTGTGRLALRALRAQGEKVGLLKIKMLRPFPGEQIRQTLKTAAKVAVIDRNFSFGVSGIFAQEVRAALCDLDSPPALFGFVAGIGGRDVTPSMIADIYWQTKKMTRSPGVSIWVGLREEEHV
jgi:pyruvate ferredoxin oxidoreductase alpha subunit